MTQTPGTSSPPPGGPPVGGASPPGAVPPTVPPPVGAPGGPPPAGPTAAGTTSTAPPTAAQAGGPPADASIGDLIGNITEDFSTLVRQEMELAKAEISQTVNKVGRGAGMFGGAGLAGWFTLLFLSLALWWALGAMIGDGDARPSLGWSALIVAAIWAIVAAVLAVTGRKEVKEAQGMPRTTETVKKIPDAVKGQDH